MIEELSEIVDEFPGEANRTRCFLHIINLVAKSMLKQFEPPKKKTKKSSKNKKKGDDEDEEEEGEEEVSDNEKEAAEMEALIAELTRDIEREESRRPFTDGGDEEEEDNLEGFIDEVAAMSEGDQETLRKQNQPIRLLLAKVSKRERPNA